MHLKQKITTDQFLHALDLLILDEFDELERLEQQQTQTVDYDCGGHWQHPGWETPAYHIEA